MNLELFIAKRIHFGREKGEKRVSSPAIKIAIAGIAIGLTAMILALSIVIGFKKEVRSKIIGFGSHIQITNSSNNNSFETYPIAVDSALIQKLNNNEDIKKVELYATKPGIIKTDDVFQGVVLKGVSADYDWTFLSSCIVEGSTINYNDTSSVNQTVISKIIADNLKLKVGDSFVVYFIQEPIKARKFEITGIYNSNLDEYDKLFILTKLDIVQKVNEWEKDQVSGIELLVTDYEKLDDIKHNVFLEMMSYEDRFGNTLFTKSIKELNPMILGWLDLLDMNVWIIIILMFMISIFTMISGLLIIILERTNMIGVLKVLGARNYSIRKTFLYVSSFLVINGMVIGNIIAFTIMICQKQFGFLKLDPSTYYTSVVPVEINIGYILLINIATLILAIITMIGPSYLIAKISPAKSIKFE